MATMRRKTTVSAFTNYLFRASVCSREDARE